jgi:hypothetical protein
MAWNQKIQKIKSHLNTQPIAFASFVHGGMLSREEGANNGVDMNGVLFLWRLKKEFPLELLKFQTLFPPINVFFLRLFGV